MISIEYTTTKDGEVLIDRFHGPTVEQLVSILRAMNGLDRRMVSFGSHTMSVLLYHADASEPQEEADRISVFLIDERPAVNVLTDPGASNNKSVRFYATNGEIKNYNMNETVSREEAERVAKAIFLNGVPPPDTIWLNKVVD